MIDTETGRAQTLRFAIDLIVRLTLLAVIVYASVLLLSPIAGMLLWSAILAVAPDAGAAVRPGGGLGGVDRGHARPVCPSSARRRGAAAAAARGNARLAYAR